MKILVLLLATYSCSAQELKLTLEEAREMALLNHPTLAALDSAAQAALESSKQIRSTLLPQISGGFTASVADDNSRLAIAGLVSSLLVSRVGTGVYLSQLLSDFGRTRLQAEAALTRATAQREGVKSARLQVLAAVDHGYYSLLRAREVTKVAEETVKARQLIVDQISTLAQSQLRSTLDVSFSKVNLSDAQILLSRAQNEIEASESDLTAALGLRDRRTFNIVDRPMDDALPPNVDPLVAKALAQRPELAQSELELKAAGQILAAEKTSYRPTVSLQGAVGALPWAQGNYPTHYGAAGVTVSIPLFNGHLFESRQREAALRVRFLEKQRDDRGNRIAREVRNAYLGASNAYERLRLTAELLAQARLSLDLAQTRYELGLGSIVELSQAQLSRTAAEVAGASARYEYQILRAALRFQVGEGEL